MIKTIIKKAFKSIGYTLAKSKEETSLTMIGALARCKARGLNVNAVIDVGASDGSWTKDCLEYFPDANYLLIEAQPCRVRALPAVSQSGVL